MLNAIIDCLLTVLGMWAKLVNAYYRLDTVASGEYSVKYGILFHAGVYRGSKICNWNWRHVIRC